MSEIFDSGSLPSKEREAYRADFNRGSNILEQATKEYLKTKEENKKKQLEKSMQETIKAMNEIINNVLHEKGVKYEEKISKDYHDFTSNTNQQTMDKLNRDVDSIEKAL